MRLTDSNHLTSHCGKALAFALALSSLGACSLAGQTVKAGVPGEERFTLTGEVPADFSFTALATFSPSQAEGCSRTFYSDALGKDVTEPLMHYERYTSERQAQEQRFNHQIPLSYSLGDCALTLSDVSFKLVGYYGPDPVFDKFPAGGGLSVYAQRPEQVPPFPSSGSLELRGLCTWLFQISSAIARKGGISKLLGCHLADQNWQIPEDRFKRQAVSDVVGLDEIAGKTIDISFRLSPEERPYMHGFWLKTPGGWKPCDNNWEGNAEEKCTIPPQFKTYKRGDQTCTVYPNCTE